MYSSSIPPEWYADQAELAAQELDFDLHMACEAEIRDGVKASFQPMPEPVPQETENSIYNFSAILDEVG